MLPRRRSSAGFTLLELLLVIVVIAILAAAVLPGSQSGVKDQLQAVARVMAGDLAYGQALAVANNSKYRFTFDLPNNRYILEHSGTNTALNTLPASPFAAPGGPSTQYIVDFDDLPHVGPTVKLVVAAASNASLQRVDTLEFGPLGATTSSSPATIWLSAGNNAATRYITLAVNPVTGLVTVGTLSADGPPAGLVN
jgi:prepilin-type N-terminal cleavage/methylation domain-containing protein